MICGPTSAPTIAGSTTWVFTEYTLGKGVGLSYLIVRYRSMFKECATQRFVTLPAKAVALRYLKNIVYNI